MYLISAENLWLNYDEIFDHILLWLPAHGILDPRRGRNGQVGAATKGKFIRINVDFIMGV
jgi:hypothetical protein